MMSIIEQRRGYRLAVPFAKAIALSFVAAAASAQDTSAKLDEYLTSATALGRFSGSVLVAQNGNVLLRKGYGLANQEHQVPNTPETKFRIGSITKPFTASAVLLLAQQGRLAVSDRVCKYVTDCPAQWGAVTVHHLLTHTSGIPNYTGFPDYVASMREPTDVVSLLSRFRDKPLDFPPGSEYRYSNSGYILLGHVIERVSSQGYGQFLRASVLGPLGLADTGYDVPFRVLERRAAGYSRAGGMVINAPYIAMSIVHSAGALFSTVDDLFKFDQALYTDRLLSANLRDSMFTPVLNGYGYGWGTDRLFNRRRVGHNGQINGFTSVLSRFPDDRVTIIALTNSDQTVPGIDRVAHDLAAIVFGESYELPRRPPVVTVDAQVMQEYTGEYELARNYMITIRRDPAGLTAQITGGAPYEMRAESATSFALDVVDARITFVRDDQGRVTHLILHKAGDQRARKIR